MKADLFSGGRIPGHQNPVPYIVLFLIVVAALLALTLGGSSDQAPDRGALPPVAEAPATDGESCLQGTPKGFELDDVEGRPLDEVERWAKGQGMTVRTVRVDGRPLAATMDYLKNRINVETVDGTVTRYCGNN